MAPRPKLLLRIVLVNAAVLLAGVLMLELVFGEWLRPNPMGRLNLLRNVTLKMDATGLYPSGTVITYTRDVNGLRGAYPDPGAIDILTLGGSATDQRYIDDSQTWQANLRTLFARDGKAVVVVNAGVDGQSTVGHIRNYEWWFPNIPGLKSRRDLFYLGANDFFTQRAFDELVAPPTLASRLKESSALFRLARTLRGIYQAASVAGAVHTSIDFAAESWTTTPRFTDHAALADQPVAQYRQRLGLLLRKSAERGARPICVTQAARYYRSDAGTVSGVARDIQFGGNRVNGVDYFHIIGQFHRATLELCAEAGGIGIDAARGAAWEDADFYDFLHNTPAGTRKLGEYLHAQLAGRF
jgi:hypothetical protein